VGVCLRFVAGFLSIKTVAQLFYLHYNPHKGRMEVSSWAFVISFLAFPDANN
jgi:hypothetical protein